MPSFTPHPCGALMNEQNEEAPPRPPPPTTTTTTTLAQYSSNSSSYNDLSSTSPLPSTPSSFSLNPVDIINCSSPAQDFDWNSLLLSPFAAATGGPEVFDEDEDPDHDRQSREVLVASLGTGRRGYVDHLQEEKGNYNCDEMMIRKVGGSKQRKAKKPRFAFQTRSSEDILDDGYRWRKYGQKSVKDSIYPRSYYRCTHLTCNVKKQVQRLSKDKGVVVTTYEGVHNHPCEKLMESLTPLLKQMQFLSSITTYI